MKENLLLPPNADAVLIVGAPNLYYFSGFPNEEAAVVLLPDKQFYITDGRYTEDAMKNVDGLKTVIVDRGESYISRAAKILSENGVKTVAIEEHSMSVKDFDVLKNAGFDTVYSSDWFYALRATKTDREIEIMRKAQSITDSAFAWILDNVREGMTEKELALTLENKMSELGSHGTAFQTIVAFGENTSQPHARYGDRKLGCGDLITVDFGAKYMGYCSDMTRTFSFGRPDDEKISVYNTVSEAQMRAIDAARTGMKARELDAVCRDYFCSKNLDKFFLHSTGHGLGIEIHEKLSISPSSNDVLSENNVFSVEPGLYFAGKFGVRIEDVVRLTKNGVDNLTKSPKHLIML